MFGYYVAAHWRGEKSLARSYWINGVLLAVALRFVFLAQAPLQQESRLETQLATGLVLLAIFASITVWQYVGIWRSATNTSRVLWPAAAKLMVILGVITSGG